MIDKRILIVEDEPLVAEEIAMHVRSMSYKVTGIAYDGKRALDLLAQKNADIVLLDINLGGSTDGIALAEIINEKYKIPFLFITSYSDSRTLNRAKHTLPFGYILKPFSKNDLLTTLEMALFRYLKQNGSYIKDVEEINSKLPTPLTAKEYELLCEICAGLTNKQIAEKHFISINTVKTHLKNIFLKLDVTNRTSIITRLRNL